MFAFTRAGDEEAQRFALELGAEWAGDSLGPPPEELDAAIIFAPVGALVPAALQAVAKGGTVVCGGHPHERHPGVSLRAAVGRAGGPLGGQPHARRRRASSSTLAPRVPVRTQVETFPLEQANEALDRLRAGNLRGSAVLLL